MAGAVLRYLRMVVDGLGYDFSRFDLDGFTEHLSDRRERSIVLVPFAFPPELHGAWLMSRATDYIFFDASAPPVLALYIKLHELGHLIMGHPTMLVDCEGDAGSLPPALRQGLSLPGPLPPGLPLPAARHDALPIRYPLHLYERQAETLARLMHLRILNLHKSRRRDQPVYQQMIYLYRLEQRITALLDLPAAQLDWSDVAKRPEYVVHALLIAVLERRRFLLASKRSEARALGRNLVRQVNAASGDDDYFALLDCMVRFPLIPPARSR